MPNYDDLFTGQTTQQEEKPFDKTAWAARKQAEREGVYAMIDSYVQDIWTPASSQGSQAAPSVSSGSGREGCGRTATMSHAPAT